LTAESLPLIQTKLYRPPVQAGLIPRPRLLERLDAHWQERPLTLISAPAGYGKSVLASMWLENCDCPSGWVSLDEEDNDLRTFVGYLLAALTMAFPDLSLEAHKLLQAPSLPPAKRLAQYLLNDLAQTTAAFIIALDDIHHIQEQSIFDFLSELLHFPAPAMHLVLICRQDPPLPVSSLRAYRRVTEVRMSHLRFSTEETVALFAQMLQQKIDEDNAAVWTEKTDGWPVALYLAALSLRGRGLTAKQDASIWGDSRYLHDYLLAEVLGALTPAWQAWLLKTSVLDRFCAALCQAVCQEEGENLTGQAFMSWLQTSNLFLIPLDDRDEWYRFHHLFQDHLQNLLDRQLGQEEKAALHLRASRWFADNNMVKEAIREALAAGDRSTAVDIFSQHRYAIANKGDLFYLEEILKLFPDETVRENAVLLTGGAENAFYIGRISTFIAYHQQLEDLLAKLPVDATLPPDIEGEIGVVTNLKILMSGTSVNMIENARKSLELLSPDAHHWRDFAFSTQIAALQMEGKLQEAELLGKETIEIPTGTSNRRFLMLISLCVVTLMEGELTKVLQYASRLVRQARQAERLEYYHGCYFMGVTHYLRNELDEAEPYLLQVTDHSELASTSYVAFSGFALMSIYHSQRRSEEAAKLFRKISDFLEDKANKANLETLKAFQVEVALKQGQIANAHRLSLAVNFDIRSILWFHYIPQLTSLKVLMQQGGKQHLEEVKTRLAELDARLHKINRKTARVDVLAMQALLFYVQNDIQPAFQKMCDSLALAAPGGFIRNFVDLGPPMADLLARLHEQGDTGMDAYVSQILAAFQIHERDTPAPDLKIPLTKRELQILKLLATDLSPQEIASEVTISVHTTRTHIRNIYRKLDIQSRYSAVELARELGLV